jgi:hypothetical protein
MVTFLYLEQKGAQSHVEVDTVALRVAVICAGANIEPITGVVYTLIGET